MTRFSILALVTALGSSALAYQDGFYSCKNIQDLPNNTYKITSVTVPGTSAKAPFVETTRYFHVGDENSEIRQVQVSGFANVFKSNDGETLNLGNIELAFENGKMAKCK